MEKKARVLLTSSYGPNDTGWGEDQYDLLSARLARGHGLFQMTSHCHAFALYLIAENITNPCTVLEHPHLQDFERELEQGYDVVCFQLLSLQMKKVAHMIRLTREKLPNAKIVVGGYGVSTLGTPVPGDKDGDAEFVRQNANYLCREEGVKFMRRILDDGPIEREITQYNMPTPAFALAGVPFHLRLPIILVALGCPNSCDFCNTSAFFYHKKEYVAEPEQTYRYMKAYQKRFHAADAFTLLFDEDFFLNAEYVRELGRLIRSDKKTWGMRYFTFGSMRALSQFSGEELRDCGLGVVWIGVESFLCEQAADARGYGKRSGRTAEDTFAELHSHGIGTIGSLVMGFDFHDNENLRQDVDRFVNLKPTFYQLSPLTPCPGTDLYERMTEEGRISDDYNWDSFTLWKDDVCSYKNLKPGDVKKHFDYAHDRIRNELGIPVVQGLEMMLDSYARMKPHMGESKYRDFSAKQTARAARAMRIYMDPILKHHDSPVLKDRIRKLNERFDKEIGWKIPLSGLWGGYVSNKLAKKAKEPPAPVVSDPPPRWTYYHTFDDRVWVKRGRKPGKPTPYKNGFLIAPMRGQSVLPWKA